MLALVQSILLVFIFFCISNFLFFKLKLSLDTKIVYGVALFSILVNFLYFTLNLKFEEIFFLFFFLCLVSLFFLKKKTFFEILNIYKFLFLIIILFALLILSYGVQHYIFRGNPWDSFTYLSVGTLVKNYTANEINILNHKFDFSQLENIYMKFQDQVYYRPLVGFVIAFLNNIIHTDPFNSVLSFKIFSTFLTLTSIRFLLKNIKNFKSKYIYILSYGFIFSHFYFYNFEIDAFSLLLSFPFFIILLSEANLFYKNILKKNNIYFIKFIILSSGFFIIYPNSASLILLIFFLFFLFILLKYKIFNYKNLKFLFRYFFLFIIFIFPSYKSTILYLIQYEIPTGLTSKIDYWGYYGAFALGKSNPIHNLEIVKYLKEMWVLKNSFFEIAQQVVNFNLETGNKYFLLNIIPSIFGFFHFTTELNNSLLNYFFIIILLYLNFYILKNIFSLILIYKNIKNDIKNLYLIILLIFLNFSFFLFLKGQYWSLIKLFFFFSPIFYLMIVLKFDEYAIKINFIFLFLMIFLPFYKYSVNNHGIGVLDSYPSILHKNLKYDVIWDINQNKLKKCSNLNSENLDYFKKLYVSIKFQYLKKTSNKIKKSCLIRFEEKKFKFIE